MNFVHLSKFVQIFQKLSIFCRNIHEQVKLVKGKVVKEILLACTRLYSSSFFSQNLISFVLFSASCIILQRFAIVAVSITTKERMQNYGLVHWIIQGRSAVGDRGHLVVSSNTLEKSNTTLKNLLDHTFSAFRIAELLLFIAHVDFLKRDLIEFVSSRENTQNALVQYHG